MLPRTYLASAIAGVSIVAFGAWFDSIPGVALFLFGYLAAFMFLRWLPFQPPSSARLYPPDFDRKFARDLLSGLVLRGVPIGMMTSAWMTVEAMRAPIRLATAVGFSLLAAAAIGLLLGALTYLTKRLGDPEKSRSA
jgi:hypothetical protein